VFPGPTLEVNDPRYRVDKIIELGLFQIAETRSAADPAYKKTGGDLGSRRRAKIFFCSLLTPNH